MRRYIPSPGVSITRELDVLVQTDLCAKVPQTHLVVSRWCWFSDSTKERGAFVDLYDHDYRD